MTLFIYYYSKPAWFVYKNADNYPEMGIYEIGRVVAGLKEDGLCNERALGVVIASKMLSEKKYFQAEGGYKYLIYLLKHSSCIFREQHI